MANDIFSCKGTGNTTLNHAVIVTNIPGTGYARNDDFRTQNPTLTKIQDKWDARFDDVGVITSTSGTTGDLTGSGGTYKNTGATALTEYNLPSASEGLNYSFLVTNSNGIRVNANTSDRILVGEVTGVIGGYVESSGVGSVLKLLAVDSQDWYSQEFEGGWFLKQ